MSSLAAGAPRRSPWLELPVTPLETRGGPARRASSRLRRRSGASRRRANHRTSRSRGHSGTRRAYPSLARFYEHPDRATSRERDFGLRWVAGDGSTYRVAWVRDTRELYSAEHLRPDGRGGRVEVLAQIPEPALERVLAGWRTICGRPHSYEWVCARLAA